MTYNVLDVAISISVILITAFLIPALKAKKSNEEWQHILNSVQIAVDAAEQIFNYKDNAKKFKFADDILKKTFPKLSAQERKMIIESVVKNSKEFENNLIN